MAKAPQTLFSCGKCGAQTNKWAGRCVECGAWASLSEEVSAPADRPVANPKVKAATITPFADLTATTEANRYRKSGLAAWDRVLGGGLVPGSVTLVGGEPGIGKSTLLAQLSLLLAHAGLRALYVTGEESPSQVALRLRRFSPTLPTALTFLDSTDAERIAATIRQEKPDLTIIDSVQTLRLSGVPGEAGNPGQIRASAGTISEAAKAVQAPVILVGQVTKDGDLAGPRLLEHLVDTVLMLEGDRSHTLRVLRALKHRFGSTEESALFTMDENGLTELTDPSAVLLAQRPKQISGSIVACLAEGSRPLLIEIQALVTSAGYGTPARRASGVDLNRVNLLLAVLARRGSLSFSDQDVFVNVVGGVEAKDPSLDLALALALASAKLDQPIPSDLIALGEIGLGGELRPVPRLDLRLKEAERLGFTQAILPPDAKIKKSGLTIHKCTQLRDALEVCGLKRVR